MYMKPMYIRVVYIFMCVLCIYIYTRVMYVCLNYIYMYIYEYICIIKWRLCLYIYVRYVYFMWVCINMWKVVCDMHIYICKVLYTYVWVVVRENVLSKMVWETRLVNQVENGNWFQSGTWFRGKYSKMIWLKEDEKGGKCFQTLVLVKVVKDLVL